MGHLEGSEEQERLMDRERFEWLVARAVESLPEEFGNKLENIDVVVEDWPTRHQLAKVGLRDGHILLGLYQGVPQTRRGGHYGLVPPDKITIFQKPIEAKCRDETEIKAEIGRVVRHEIAHHFGIGDGRLRELEGDDSP
jgi:predicted Zn-dependent protease with MMP-like domain